MIFSRWGGVTPSHPGSTVPLYKQHTYKINEAEFETLTRKNCFCKTIFDFTRKKIEIASIRSLASPEHPISCITVAWSGLLLLLKVQKF